MSMFHSQPAASAEPVAAPEPAVESVSQDAAPVVSEETAATVAPEPAVPDVAPAGTAPTTGEEQKPSLISRLLGLVGI
jgi:hypothetical protein